MSNENPAGDEHGSSAGDGPAEGVASSAAEAADSVASDASTPPDATSTPPPRKRTARPKPARKSPPPPKQEPDQAADGGADDGADVAAEQAAADVAQAEGSTGDPIPQAAVDAVVEGPGSFSAPAEKTVAAGDTAPGAGEVPSANGSSRPRSAVMPQDLSVGSAPAATDPRRFAPVAAVLAAVVGVVLWRRRR